MDDERVVGGRGGDARQGAASRPAETPEQAARRALDGEAWRSFCRTLERAGETLRAPGQPDAPGARAEGVRYLAGLVVSGLRQALELDDPLRPRFLRNPDSAARWGADNADNQYLWARIDPAGRYAIRGERGTSFDFLVEVKEGYMQLGAARNFATLTAQSVPVDANGRFEIRLGGPEREGAWLPLDPEARYVAIRQFFADWEHERPARFEIERLDAPAEPPAPADPAGAARTLDEAAAWIEASARVWSDWVAGLREAHRPDAVAPARLYVGGADDIRYGNDLYRVADGEALVLECVPPRARYWGFQLCDGWFRSLDYAHRQTSLNHAQARLDADGRVRVVVAGRDPGVPNWLDATGHPEGVLQYRWIWTEDSPRPSLRRVPLASLRDALPADTPRVDPEARRRTLAARARHVARREPAS